MGKNKRNRNYYIQPAKRQRTSCLGPDMLGFLCMCNGREKDCVREAYNILNEFADQLYGKETVEVKEEDKPKDEKPGESDESDDEDVDIDAAIKADMNELNAVRQQDKKLRRFQQVKCEVNNCVFIKTTLDDPVRLSLAIMDSIVDSRQQKTKRLLRMIPVQKTCKASYRDIEKAVDVLAKSYFEKESKSYYIAIKITNNSSLEREELTKKLIETIQASNSDNTPDLNTPEIVMNVIVLKTVCCLSLLPGFFDKYSKYNLVEIAKKTQAKQSDLTPEDKDGQINNKPEDGKAETNTEETKEDTKNGDNKPNGTESNPSSN